MYNMNSPIKIYSIEEAMGISNRKKREANNNLEVRKRKFDFNLISYYNLEILFHVLIDILVIMFIHHIHYLILLVQLTKIQREEHLLP